MAILKHIASKNADYGEAQRYLIFNMMNPQRNRCLMRTDTCNLVKNIIWTESTVIPLPLIRNASN